MSVSNPSPVPGSVHVSSPRSSVTMLRSAAATTLNHLQRHTGVGIVCAVAYFDPGNWGVDLQAGSQFGYKLLFVVLLAGLFAVILQVLASRLGCVTGLDLASHCRLLLYDRTSRPRLVRYLTLYPLYILSEIAIISTDLAELLGSAIALCMLFPSLPLSVGVLITAADVLLLLALRDPLQGRPVKMFEFVIAAMVLAVLICMAIIIAKINVDWAKAFDGFVPSKALFQNGGLYTSVGILGATVMPHSLFLGSALATQDRTPSVSTSASTSKLALALSEESFETLRTTSAKPGLSSRIRAFIRGLFCVPPRDPSAVPPRKHSDRENNPYAFVRAHLYHGIVDVAVSLLGFAVLINALILILAGAVFFYGSGGTGSSGPASLFDAHNLIKDMVGKGAATLFALALLAAGQSASIIATLAGQSVSEGFLRWRVSPIVRRLLTRLIGLIPSMVVAIAVGRPGIDALLVASQVVLSIVLPFVTLPLVYLTSSRRIMAVRTEAGALVDFSSGLVLTGLGYAIWLVVCIANVYVIVTLAMGKGG